MLTIAHNITVAQKRCPVMNWRADNWGFKEFLGGEAGTGRGHLPKDERTKGKLPLRENIADSLRLHPLCSDST